MQEMGKALGMKLMDFLAGPKMFKTLILQNAHGDIQNALEDLQKMKSFFFNLTNNLSKKNCMHHFFLHFLEFL